MTPVEAKKYVAHYRYPACFEPLFLHGPDKRTILMLDAYPPNLQPTWSIKRFDASIWVGCRRWHPGFAPPSALTTPAPAPKIRTLARGGCIWLGSSAG